MMNYTALVKKLKELAKRKKVYTWEEKDIVILKKPDQKKEEKDA